MTSNQQAKTLILKQKVIRDAKEKTISQSFKNVKLTAQDAGLYNVSKLIVPLLEGNGVEILKDDLYELTE